ncbi:hypothetical protein CQA38_08860 [Campylobacter sp. MIT 12-5580]|uniref:hypothetical protein n=1 Tax=Campylobacter sp. MIT 12-5580 TaxID=2040651 RepID=UPI0010F7CADD|nr:hypothetical protein [Campylobacter sp. MIT 12-5580]TKX28139.1 hypothetical protein CQA38_08860 [Campylobacter sp. MIT 12-5580]
MLFDEPNNPIDKRRKAYVLRLNLLRFFAFFQGFIIFMVLIKVSQDFVLAFAGGALFGYGVYRLFISKAFAQKKLIDEKIELEKLILEEFLKEEEGKFSNEGIKEKEFKSLFNFKPSEFKSANAFEFKNFKLYDVLFKDERNRFFIGVLLISQNLLQNDKMLSQDEFYSAKIPKKFSTELKFIQGKACLIKTRINPFFIHLHLSLEQNKSALKQNLAQLEKLLS